MTADEAKADAAEEQFQARIDAIAEGDLAITAVARGETADRTALDRSADATAEILADNRVTAPTWTTEDVEPRRRLRALLTSGAPSPEARAATAEGRGRRPSPRGKAFPSAGDHALSTMVFSSACAKRRRSSTSGRSTSTLTNASSCTA